MRISFNVGEISFFIEEQTLTLDERDYFLKDIVGCHVDLVNQNPIPIFHGFNQIALKETEHQIAIDFI